MQEQNQSYNQQQTQKPPMQAKPAMAPAPQQNNHLAKYAGMVVVGVIAGVVLAWGWVSWRSPAVDTAQDTAGTLTSDTTGTPAGRSDLGADTGVVGVGSDPALTIVSPQPAGDSVAVAKAVVSSPTWIVVYENNAGQPGNALGAALFFPGGQSGTVELLRSTTAGKTYLAARQTDNGDRKFSLKDDQLLTEGGQVQWVTFETK